MNNNKNVTAKPVKGHLTGETLRWDVIDAEGRKVGEVKRMSGLGWGFRTQADIDRGGYFREFQRAASKTEAIEGASR